MSESTPPTLDYSTRTVRRTVPPPQPLPVGKPQLPVAYPPPEPSPPLVQTGFCFCIVPIGLVVIILYIVLRSADSFVGR